MLLIVITKYVKFDSWPKRIKNIKKYCWLDNLTKEKLSQMLYFNVAFLFFCFFSPLSKLDLQLADPHGNGVGGFTFRSFWRYVHIYIYIYIYNSPANWQPFDPMNHSEITKIFSYMNSLFKLTTKIMPCIHSQNRVGEHKSMICYVII